MDRAPLQGAWRDAILAIAGFSAVLAYFLFLAWNGLVETFTPDDTTNMYSAWIVSFPHLLKTATFALWEGEVRPLGLLFYHSIHRLFGFDPFPFRLACFLLIGANLALQLRLFIRAMDHVGFALLALLVACFNGTLWSIYASTGTVFDILCLFFLLLTLNAYIAYIERPRWFLLGLTYLFALWAMQSKEMGYAAPALLLCYEICYAIPAAGRPYAAAIRNALLRVVPIVAIAALGLAGMLFGSRVMFRLSAYSIDLSWTRYVETNAAHLTMLLFREWKISPTGGLILLVVALIAAIALRSRAALFGWLFFIAALLPISFVAARSDGYVLYTAYTGCAIYVAAMVESTARILAAPFSRRWRTAATATAAILFAFLVVHVQHAQAAVCLRRGFGPGGQSLVQDLTSTAASAAASGARRVILVDDPFGEDKWQPMFILRLSRGDVNLRVLRLTSNQLQTGPAPKIEPGDQVLLYSPRLYQDIPPADLVSRCSRNGK